MILMSIKSEINGTCVKDSGPRARLLCPYYDIVLNSRPSFWLPQLWATNWMHGFEVHEALYPNCEFRGSGPRAVPKLPYGKNALI